MSAGPPALAGLVGAPGAEARERLGEPEADRPARPGRWIVWGGDGWRLRLRVGGGAEAPDGNRGPGPAGSDGESGDGAEGRITSWSLTWERPRSTLREAVEPLGLWPAAAPDVRADELKAPLARRGLTGPAGRTDRSLTATVRAGGFARIAVFDEAPEW